MLGQALPMALGRLGPQVSSLPHQWWPSWCPWSYLSLGHRWFKAEEVSKLMAFPSTKYPTKTKTFRRADFFDWTPRFTLGLTWGLWKLVVVNKNKRLQDLENGIGEWFLWVLCLKKWQLDESLHTFTQNQLQSNPTNRLVVYLDTKWKWSHPGCGYIWNFLEPSKSPSSKWSQCNRIPYHLWSFWLRAPSPY